MKKILVVEDDESQQLLYHDELAEAGYEVILASNGKEALKRLDKARPNLVILDIVMPMMDGMEALGRIIRKYRDLPIILNTAYPSYKDDFMRWGGGRIYCEIVRCRGVEGEGGRAPGGIGKFSPIR